MTPHLIPTGSVPVLGFMHLFFLVANLDEVNIFDISLFSTYAGVVRTSKTESTDSR